MSIRGSIELTFDEVEVQVDYTYYPATRQTWANPAEDADIDINSCIDAFGRARDDIAERLLESNYLIERVEEDLDSDFERKYRR